MSKIQMIHVDNRGYAFVTYDTGETIISGYHSPNGNRPPNYPVPAIRYEVDYIRECFNGETLACVLWYMSNPDNPVCLEFWN